MNLLHRFVLILRFYRLSMSVFGGAVTACCMWLAAKYGAPIVPWLLLMKLVIYAPLLYVWVIPLFGNQFFYYLNLGIRRRWLLAGACAADFAICCAGLTIAILLFR